MAPNRCSAPDARWTPFGPTAGAACATHAPRVETTTAHTTEMNMTSPLLEELLVRQRLADYEREIVHARLLREAAAARRAQQRRSGGALQRAIAARIAVAGAWAGNWLVLTGSRMQSMALVPVPCPPPR